MFSLSLSIVYFMMIFTSVGVQSLTISSNPRISPKNIVTHSNSSTVCWDNTIRDLLTGSSLLSPDPFSCPAPVRAAENRGRLSLSVVSGCQAPGLFPRVAWKTPKTWTAADTRTSACQLLADESIRPRRAEGGKNHFDNKIISCAHSPEWRTVRSWQRSRISGWWCWWRTGWPSLYSCLPLPHPTHLERHF